MKLSDINQLAIYGIFGYPVEHSASPVMHNAAFKALGIHAEYKKFPVAPEDLQSATGNIIKNCLRGINVTIPHKQNIMKFLDELAPSALTMGAVNTVQIKGDRIIGHNTDGEGFKQALKAEAGVELNGKTIFLAGSGGAGFAVATKCVEENIKQIAIMDIDLQKANWLADHLRKFAGTKTNDDFVLVFSPKNNDAINNYLKTIDIAVNATPLGMKINDPIPLPVDILRKNTVVYDLVYNIPVTSLVNQARENGIKAYTGLSMLLYQGVESFKIWTGINPPVEIMKKALEDFIYGVKD